MRKVLSLGCAAVLAVGLAPATRAEPPPGAGAVDSYPIAAGRYSSPGDFYWVFFKTPDGRSCGIGPNGGPIGCDAVPMDAPAGANQTVIEVGGVPASYRRAETASFTRDVDVLPQGYRLENWGSRCAVGYQGTVTCQGYGSHGFTISAVYGVLW
ncbi:MAG: hypothetical protein WBH51_21530 [Mycolicibacter algericus]|uniref:hypothetical protein n=1 Tax=Mycolicibacter algericus TaxID=1288388 RepID=UPI003C71F929